jgi:hypothetical protein
MRKVIWTALAAGLVSVLAMAGKGNGGGTSAIDLSTVRTVSGTVAAVSMNQGMGQPGFTMNTSEGAALSVHLGPYWYIVSKNFSVAVGNQVTAKVADCVKTSDEGDVVAFQVANVTTGAQITLRDDQGVPLWKGGRRGGNGNGGPKAEGAKGQRGSADGCSASKVDLSTLQELEGTATAVNGGLGARNNTITFTSGGQEYRLGLGPYWYMTEHGFALAQGDALKVKMAQCAKGWAAFSVTKTATGQALLLRDETTGVPLWLH